MGAHRVLALGASGLVFAAMMMAGATGIVSASLLGNGTSGGAAADAAGAGAGGAGGAGEDVTPTSLASSEIPPGMLTLYQAAAADTCSGLPWTVLAAIGTVESGNGTSDLPGGHAGANSAGAEGPMQFEAPPFAAYALPVPPGGATPPTPY